MVEVILNYLKFLKLCFKNLYCNKAFVFSDFYSVNLLTFFFFSESLLIVEHLETLERLKSVSKSC